MRNASPSQAACGAFGSFPVENWLHTPASVSSLEQLLGLLLKFTVSNHSSDKWWKPETSAPINLHSFTQTRFKVIQTNYWLCLLVEAKQSGIILSSLNLLS